MPGLENSKLKLQLPVLSTLYCIYCRGYSRQMLVDLQPVGGRQHKNSQLPPGAVLLVTQVLVGGDKHIELPFRHSPLVTCHRSPVSWPPRQATTSANEDSVNLSTVRTCSRFTPGNHSRNCSTVAPPSRFSNKARTGTRVFLNNHAPLTLPGTRSTAGQCVQSIMPKPCPRLPSTASWKPGLGKG